MSRPFRKTNPVRSVVPNRSSYKAYKDELARDFNHRCGYTDCRDSWFGGQRTFQIDHLKPWSKYPNLKNEYGNLVYCCSYVNRAKWDDDSQHYLDPCNVDYNEHFERDDNGFIIGKGVDAKYMVEKLHLNLTRYALIWMLDTLDDIITRLKAHRTSHPELEDLLNTLLSEYHDYIQYFHNHQ